jgi:hypothetical protein
MPHPRRRAPRSPLRRYAYVVLIVAAVLVAGALISGSAVLVGVAAVLAVVLAIAAAACLVEESLQIRQSAAGENATLAAAYTGLFARQATDHQSELDRLAAQVVALVGRTADLAARNAELADRNADLELAAGLWAAARRKAADEDRDAGSSTVVTLPVQQFDHTPVEHAQASGL